MRKDYFKRVAGKINGLYEDLTSRVLGGENAKTENHKGNGSRGGFWIGKRGRYGAGFGKKVLTSIFAIILLFSSLNNVAEVLIFAILPF